MHRFYTCFAVIMVTLLQFASVVSAGSLDDYYLQQFGETRTLQLQKAILSVLPEAQKSARCGMPLKHGLKRDWNLLEQATQKVLAKQLALPTLSGTEQFVISAGGHYRVHYTDSGVDAPHMSDYTVGSTLIRGITYYTGLTSTSDWAATVAATFENIYAQYNTLGYQPAPVSSGTYDIYLNNQASLGYYGVTTSGNNVSSITYPNGVTSWIELDSSFTDPIFHPNTYSPLQSLQITAAHEYHHAIQYGYNYYFDIWYAEATSTWMEDELYDSVNQLYNYIPEWFSNSTKSLDLAVGADAVTTGAGYGRWIFNRYLAEKHGTDMIRSAWEKVGSLNSPGGYDIPMVPVLDSLLFATYSSTLSTDFFDFAKRIYTRDWTSHLSDTGNIPAYSPVTTYSTYPVSTNTVTLPHYSFAYYKFMPSAGAPANLNITVTGTSGIKATAFIKSSGGVITEYPFSAVAGTTVAVPGFSTSSEVVLLIANTTDTDNHTANFSTNGTSVPVTEPTGGTVYPPTAPVTPVNNGGGSSKSSSGCFIATAAYGSYLHPQVQLLRNFRDEHLLTNAPGRAFVACYYRLSPPLAAFIARHPLLRGVTRLILTPITCAVVHPAATGAGLLLAILILYRPLRRRVLKLVAVG